MPRFLPLESKLKKLGFSLIAGIDEAGMGPLAGPLVSAAVILKRNAKLPYLNDSKKLSKKKREELFPLIIKNSIAYAITVIPPQTIDKINIQNALRQANFLNIHFLKPKPKIAIIDGNMKQSLSIPYKNIIKGDQKVRSIAAASILAKVTRDLIMKYYAKKFPKYQFQSHKGYGTRLHRSNIKKYGRCGIHRKSYKVSL